MADEGAPGALDWMKYLMSLETWSPVDEVSNWIPEGVWNYGVAEGVWNNGVVEGMGNNGVVEGVWNNGLVEGMERNGVLEGMGNDGVVEGMGNDGVVEGMERNDVVEGMGEKGAELMVGAAGSNSQRSPSGSREEGPVSNDNYGGFEVDVPESSMAADQVPRSPAKVRKKKKWAAERKAGWAPPPGSEEMSSGGTSVDYSMFASHIIKSVVVAPQAQGIVMGGAPPRAGAKRKRQWANEGVSVWWDRPGYTDADFKRDFHMSRSTFATLCDALAPSVAKKDTSPRAAIPVPQRVAVCVYRFAMGASFRDIQERFGHVISTCQKFVLDVTAAINAVFQAGCVSALWPHGTDAMDTAAARFQALTGGVPGVIGAVYTTHVSMVQPEHNVAYYYNRRLTQRNGKTSFSLSLQAAVDADGAFTDFCLGYPGGASEEQIFSLSSMSTTYADEMVAQGKRLVGGTGYPLTDWTLVPYTGSDLTPAQETFNEKLALARGVAPDAFRRLKARWACLQGRGTGKLDVFASVMAACCVLHNLCERSGDELGDELKAYKLDDDDEMVLDDPVRSAAAAQVRDAIAHSLAHHAGAGWSMPS